MDFRHACLLPVFLPLSWLGASACEPDVGDSDKGRAEQKLVLLERMTDRSAPAKRVADIGSESARELLDKARGEAANARAKFIEKCYGEASDLAAEGLVTASAAFRADANSNAAEVTQYRGLWRRAQSLLETLESQGEDVSGLNEAELIAMQRQLARAERLALEGEHQKATTLLAPVADRLERRLFDVFDKRTLVYTREFKNPSEEYAYLLENFRGYRLLLGGDRVSIGSAPGSAEAVAAMLAEADVLVERSKNEMSRERWGDAVRTMRQAIKTCEQASRISGIQF